MKLNGNFVVQAPRQQVWDALNDVDKLAQIIPGAQNLTQTGPDRYSATMRVGVGPIKSNFNGTVAISEQREPEHYRLDVEGQAKQGQMKGSGAVDLEEVSEGSTQVRVDAEFHVSGMIARVGQRMMSGVANQLMQTFFKELERQAAAHRSSDS